MSHKLPPPATLYSAFFQPEIGDLSAFWLVEDHAESEKYLSILTALRNRLAGPPLEKPAQTALESLFISLIIDQVKAAYTADDVFAIYMKIMRELCPWDEHLETKPNISSNDWEEIERISPCPPFTFTEE